MEPPQIEPAPINDTNLNVVTIHNVHSFSLTERERAKRQNWGVEGTSERDGFLESSGIIRQVTLNEQNESIPTDPRLKSWIQGRQFYVGATNLSNYIFNFADFSRYGNRIRNESVAIHGATEFMEFFEMTIQKCLQESSRSLLNQGEIHYDSYVYCANLVCKPREQSTSSLRHLFFNFYNGDFLNALFNRTGDNFEVRWSDDMKKIMKKVINSISSSYQNNPERLRSYFLEMIPILKVTGPLPRDSWIYSISSNNHLLYLLFTLFMIRLPSYNLSTDNTFGEIRTTLTFKNIDTDLVTDRKIPINIMNANLQNLFYFIPEYKRVIGIWPDNVYVQNETDQAGDWYKIGYNMNLIRNIIVKIDIPRDLYNQKERLVFDNLFLSRGEEPNLYLLVRNKNLFNLPRYQLPYAKFYVELTIYANHDDPLIHIPWIRDSSVSGKQERNDIDGFISHYTKVLTSSNSGAQIQARGDEYSDFYCYFSFIYNPTIQDYTDVNEEGEQDMDVNGFEVIHDDDGGGDEEEKGDDRVINRRAAPAPPVPVAAPAPPVPVAAPAPPVPVAAPAPPPPPVARRPVQKRQFVVPPVPRSKRLINQRLGVTLSKSIEDEVYRPEDENRRRSERILIAKMKKKATMKGGAPYVGTAKEKHFLEASLMNKFTISAALFKTPETKTNSCLIMSLIRAQMYNYRFKDGVCNKILVTGTSNSLYKSDTMMVECIGNFNGAPYEYPFLKKRDNKWYVQLFNASKIRDGDKFLAGAVNSTEEYYWLMAAEEIWFHLQMVYRRDIDYNNVAEFCQAFSDYFNVCISIYDVEIRCARVSVFTPFSLSPKELVNRTEELLMVHIVYDQGHFHAISSFPEFVKTDNSKAKHRLYNYCPICDKKQITELTETRDKSMAHITKCVSKKDFVVGYETKMEEMSKPNLMKVQKSYRKKENRKKQESFFQCKQCFEEVTQMDWMNHVCKLQKKKVDSLDERNIYVYDLESAQMIDKMGLLKHECNCLYIRKVYTENEQEEQGIYFHDEIDFIKEIVSNPIYKNCTFIAHNGGSYDVQFLLRVLERTEIEHTYVPSPTSNHKFIQINITHNDLNIRFIDFMRFIPGSLKKIAEAFEIPVSKGDFPHKFNNGKNDQYVGQIPSMFTSHDWWNISSAKNEKDLQALKLWFFEQTKIYCTCTLDCNCTKKKWDFQEEIKKYCLLDVVVLAEIVKSYRFACMNFDEDNENKIMNWVIPKMDPLQFMTLPQITINTFINGFETLSHSDYDFDGIVTLSRTKRGGQSNDAILWLYRIEQAKIALGEYDPIYYLGNSLKEWYDFDLHINIDGYAPESDTAYIFLKCDYWCCPDCMKEYNEFNWMVPNRNLYANDIRNQLESIMDSLNQEYTKVIYKWGHNINTSFTDPYLIECSKLFKPEDAFYGGRVEVFRPFVKAVDKEIHYYDVTSLYPSVYAQCELPLGIPIHLIGENIDLSRLHPTASNRYWGFVKCYVIPNKKDIIGLLPKRDEKSGRLFFPVIPMLGCWCTNEIYLAMQNGYEVKQVYEIYHWEQRQRSDKHLAAYVNYFFQMKQEAEGWKKLGASSETPSEEEKDEIVERLFIQNGNLGRIRKEKVKKNAVLRALAKLYLNSLWGKWAQKPSKNNNITIYGSYQLLDLINNPQVQMDSCKFREISPGVYKSNFKLKDEYLASVRHGNLFIGAAVTATARCILHSKMIQVGVENMVYCDTDSIIFLYDRILGELTDIGLGKWTNEYPMHHIVQFYGLAPKLYSLMLKDKSHEKEPYEVFRAKGVQLTLENQTKMVFNNIKPLIEQLITGKVSQYSLEVNNMNIFTNSTNNMMPFGQVYTRYNKKKVRAIITKRCFELVDSINWEVINEIRTYPFGYEIASNGDTPNTET